MSLNHLVLAIGIPAISLAALAAACHDAARGEGPTAPAPAAAAAPTATATAPIAPTAATPSNLRHVAGQGYEGWVVLGLPGDAFDVSDAEVAELEAALPAAVAAAQAAGELVESGSDLAARLPGYVRRYEGYKTGLIDIGLYCATQRAHAAAADTRVGDVKGGGDCFVTARYDTGDHKMLWVQSNARR